MLGNCFKINYKLDPTNNLLTIWSLSIIGSCKETGEQAYYMPLLPSLRNWVLGLDNTILGSVFHVCMYACLSPQNRRDAMIFFLNLIRSKRDGLHEHNFDPLWCFGWLRVWNPETTNPSSFKQKKNFGLPLPKRYKSSKVPNQLDSFWILFKFFLNTFFWYFLDMF